MAFAKHIQASTAIRKGRFGGTLNGFLDSGCTYNLIPLWLATSLKRVIHETSATITAHGKEKPIFGTAQYEISIADTCVKAWFGMIDADLDYPVLGMSYLSYMRAALDAGANTLVMHHEEPPRTVELVHLSDLPGVLAQHKTDTEHMR